MNSTTTQHVSNVQRPALPVIAGHEVALDEHGRFNLNAIHAASGSDKNKRPSNWSRSAQAVEMIAELESKCSDLSISVIEARKGSGGGTFAHELLAVSYAGWISPRFQLQVNQVFLDYRMGKLEAKPQILGLPNPLTPRHQRELQKAIASRIYAEVPQQNRPAAFKHVYRDLKDRFDVAKYDQIDDSRYTEALGAVQSCSLEGQFMPKREALAEPGAGSLMLGPNDVTNLLTMCQHVKWVERRWQSELGPALTMLGSRHATECFEHVIVASRLAHSMMSAAGALGRSR